MAQTELLIPFVKNPPAFFSSRTRNSTRIEVTNMSICKQRLIELELVRSLHFCPARNERPECSRCGGRECRVEIIRHSLIFSCFAFSDYSQKSCNNRRPIGLSWAWATACTRRRESSSLQFAPRWFLPLDNAWGTGVALNLGVPSAVKLELMTGELNDSLDMPVDDDEGNEQLAELLSLKF